MTAVQDPKHAAIEAACGFTVPELLEDLAALTGYHVYSSMVMSTPNSYPRSPKIRTEETPTHVQISLSYLFTRHELHVSLHALRALRIDSLTASQFLVQRLVHAVRAQGYDVSSELRLLSHELRMELSEFWPKQTKASPPAVTWSVSPDQALHADAHSDTKARIAPYGITCTVSENVQILSLEVHVFAPAFPDAVKVGRAWVTMSGLLDPSPSVRSDALEYAVQQAINPVRDTLTFVGVDAGVLAQEMRDRVRMVVSTQPKTDPVPS